MIDDIYWLKKYEINNEKNNKIIWIIDLNIL
jgi:hypothetical protein